MAFESQPNKAKQTQALEIDVDEILAQDTQEESIIKEEKKALIKKKTKGIKSILIAFLLFLVLFESALLKYVFLLGDPNPSETNKQLLEQLKPYVGWVFGQTSQSVPGRDYQKVAVFLDSNASYGEKKEAVQNYINKSISFVKAKLKTIEEIKQEIWAYPYLPSSVFEQMGETEWLKRLLLSVEAIRTYSIAKLYSYMDSFVLEISRLWREPRQQTEDKLKFFLNRGEKDIVTYLEMCYMNSYDPQCLLDKSFDNYLTNQFIDAGLDAQTAQNYTFSFKLFVQHLIRKIETDPKPIVSLVLNNLDPQKWTVSFKVEISIPQQVYVQLLKKLPSQEPNLFVVSQMINLLRGSHFIVGDGLKIDSIKVNLKKEKIGKAIKNYYVSSYTFTVPIQKQSQVEIYDFKY